MNIKKQLAALLLVLSLSTPSHAFLGSLCICLVMEYPKDGGLSIMTNFADMTLNTMSYSFMIFPYVYALDYFLYGLERKHANGLWYINSAVLMNRGGLRTQMQSMATKGFRADTECQNSDAEIVLLESQILYLEQLLAEVALESSKRLQQEKYDLWGR